MATPKNKKDLLLKPIPDPPKHHPDSKYKPKKPKVNWESKLYGCPFCGIELPKVTNKIPVEMWVKTKNPAVSRLMKYFEFPKRAKKCRSCGARVLRKACPACKGNIWFDKKTGIYKHGRHNGCGFVGTKLPAK